MKRNILALAILSSASLIVAAQAQQQAPPAQTPPASDSKPSESKVRIYVSDSTSWEASGSWGTSNGNGGGSSRAGARPQTAEIIKTFNERCPQYTITSNKDKANFAVVLDHEGGKGALQRRNKIAVFNRDGDVIFSDSTRSLGNSVKDACAAIDKDSSKK